jgi:hypothetical protein
VYFLVFSSTEVSDSIFSNSAPSLNAWHHIVGTFDAGNAAIYIDGQLDNSATLSVSSIMNDVQPLILGGIWDYCGTDEFYNTFTGKLDDVRIYDRALSASEVEVIYDSGLPVVPSGDLVVNGSFETIETTGGGWPNAYGHWNGEHSYVVGSAGAVTPFEGTKMLKFAGTEASGAGAGNTCEVYQIIDISEYAGIIATGEAVASASVYFNRAVGDGGTDTQFELSVQAYAGDPCSFPTLVEIPDSNLSGATSIILSDSDEGTWQQCDVELPLPLDTDFVTIGLIAIEDMANNLSLPEFDGHFADVASMQIDIEPNEPNEPNEPDDPNIYYVDGVNGSDLYNGASLETAFATIQQGINTAVDGDTVLVYPDVYSEAIYFGGKEITIDGVATTDGIPVISVPSDYAVSFYDLEDSDSALKHFVIRDSEVAVFVADASPTLSFLTIVDNDFGISAYGSAIPEISNCIFWNNLDGDLFGCEAQYSYIGGDINEPCDVIDGLVSHWKFDEGSGSTAYDSVGNNDGTISGATWTSGQINGAMDFDGSSDYVNIGQPASLANMGSGTIMMLFNPNTTIDGTLSNWISLFQKNDSETALEGDTFVAFSPSGYLKLDINNDSDTQFQIFSDENYWPAGVWQHVVASWDNSTDAIRMYINGAEQSDTLDSFTGLAMGVARDIVIGGNSEKNAYWFDGLIDEVAVFDKALSIAEVEQVYSSGISVIDSNNSPMFVDELSGDYLLKSHRGRYWSAHDVWILDEVMSPCIDIGDPSVEPSNEPTPNGGRVNAGAYGNTAYASMSEWSLPEDINRDGIVNLIDFGMLGNRWLDEMSWIH